MNTRTICTICARGGSKSVPRKNLRPIAGKPLIAWTIELALGLDLFDTVSVSSDCEEILAFSEKLGVQSRILRPKELASDTAGKLPAIVHCLRENEKASGLEYTHVVDLDCTSPFEKRRRRREGLLPTRGEGCEKCDYRCSSEAFALFQLGRAR